MLDADRAVKDRSEDLLGLTPLVARLLDAATAWSPAESLVIGLYGEWGSGKTSILNMLQTATTLPDWEARAPVIVRFNPWLYGSTETLLASFFRTLATEIRSTSDLDESTREQIAAAISELGEAAAPLLEAALESSLAGRLGKSLAKRFGGLFRTGERDLLGKREKASELLRKLAKSSQPRRVLVLIDDLDRLESDETAIILKLVKLVGDLPNVTYIVAMDPVRVASTIDRSGSGEGHSYLDKIVQIPIHVPPIPPDRLRTLVVDRIQETLRSGGLLSPDNALSLPSWAAGHEFHYDKVLKLRVRTLRDLSRFTNNLAFLTRPTPQRLEVHPGDIVLFSFLQTFFPAAIEAIRRERSFLIAERDALDVRFNRDAAKEGAEAQKRLLGLAERSTGEQSTTSPSIRVVHSALATLFPHSQTPGSLADPQRLSDRQANRMCSPERFDRYFRLAMGPGEISDQEFNDWLSESDEPKASRSLARLLDPDSLASASFEAKLEDHIQSASAGDLATTISRIRSILPSVPGDRLLGLAHSASFAAIREISGEHPDSDLYQAVMAELTSLISALEDQDTSILMAADLSRLSERELQYPAIMVERIIGCVMPTVTTALSDPRQFASTHGFDTFSNLIWRMRDLLVRSNSSVQPLKAALLTMLTDPANLPKVLALGAIFSNGPRFDNGRHPKETSDALSNLVDPRDLYERAVKSSPLPAESDPYHLVPQFVSHMKPLYNDQNGV